MRQSTSFPGTSSAPPNNIEVSNANGASIMAIRVDNPSQDWYFAGFANAYIPPFTNGWVYRYERPVTRETLTLQTPPNYSNAGGLIPFAQLFVVVEVSDNPDEFGYGAPFGAELGPRIGSAGQAIQEVYLWQANGPSPPAIKNDISVFVDGPSGQEPMALSIPVVIASNQSSVPVTATITGNPADNIAQWGGVATTLGQKVMASSVPVAIASDQSDVKVNVDQIAGVPPDMGVGGATTSTLRVNQSNMSTVALTNVAGSASSVSLIAANNLRRALVIANDSTSILYVCLGAGPASTTNYSYQMAGSTAGGIAHLELVWGDGPWVGAVQGIWASATGNARITEIRS